MVLRHAAAKDLPRIVAIYNTAIPTGQSTADIEPVSVDARREWFSGHSEQRRPLLVHEVGGQIVAWVSFEAFYGRPAYRYTAELSIYIAPENQGQRLGRQLLSDALARAPELGIKSLVGYVFAHNEPSMRLLRSFGFQEWGRLPDVAEIDGNEYSLCIMGRRLAG